MNFDGKYVWMRNDSGELHIRNGNNEILGKYSPDYTLKDTDYIIITGYNYSLDVKIKRV